MEYIDMDAQNAQNASTKTTTTEKVDKRKITSRANMAKARETKIQQLKAEKEMRDKIKTISTNSQAVRMPANFELDDDEDEETIIYNYPTASKVPVTNTQDPMLQIKQMLQEVLLQQKPKKTPKKKDNFIVIQQPNPAIMDKTIEKIDIDKVKPKANSAQAEAIKKSIMNF